MYPVFEDGVSTGTFTHKGRVKECYYVENADGDMFEIDEAIYEALIQMDGRHPLPLEKNIVEYLKKQKVIRTSRFASENSFYSKRMSLFFIGERAKVLEYPCKIINAILPIVSIIVFIAGLSVRKWMGGGIDGDISFLLYVIIMVVSTILHELGHMIAAIAYDYTISEVGLLFWGPLPIGGYVATEENAKDRSRKQEIQFTLAGIEMNLLFIGICLYLSILYNSFSFTFVYAAFMNILLVIDNLLPISGYDGEGVLNTIFGVESIAENARIGLTNKKWRKKLLYSGLPGFLCFFVFGLILLLKYIERVILVGGFLLPIVLVLFL